MSGSTPDNGSAITTIAQPNGDGVPDNGSAIMMLAQPLKTEVSPPADAITRKAQPLSETPADAGAAITMIAADYHQDSELLSPGEQAAIILIAQPLSESTPSLAPRDAKEIYKEEKELLIESISDESDESSDIEAFAQRYADQQVLQSLLAEHQSLQTLQPGRSGWGAAQRRLRALAPEITRLQAVCTTQVVAPNSDKPEALSSEPGTPDAGWSRGRGAALNPEHEVPQSLRILPGIWLGGSLLQGLLQHAGCFLSDASNDVAFAYRLHEGNTSQGWKDHGTCQRAFTRLLRDLKVDNTSAEGAQSQ